MSLSLADVLAVLRRRWYLILVGLLVTVGLGWAATTFKPPDYTARGLVLLVPSQATVGEGGNPLLALAGLDLPARVLVAYFSSDAAQQQFAKAAPDAEIVVTMEESTRGPVIAIDVKDPTPDGATGTLRLVADAIPPNLARLQGEVGAPASTEVSSLELAMDEKAKIDRSDSTRVLIMAIGLGLAGTAFLTFAVDGMILQTSQARKRRAARATGDDAGEEGGDAADTPDVVEPTSDVPDPIRLEPPAANRNIRQSGTSASLPSARSSSPPEHSPSDSPTHWALPDAGTASIDVLSGMPVPSGRTTSSEESVERRG
ncbi:hypothetical protein [Cellulomonas sp.]|uniref:hypothetical protein n=1 Tax=Cellulomonas sp. TaxID=40001 RepID=UPI003BAB909F